MISIRILNSLNDEQFDCTVACNGATIIQPEIHRYMTDFVLEHGDRDIRFYFDIHRNYYEDDVFKGFQF